MRLNTTADNTVFFRYNNTYTAHILSDFENAVIFFSLQRKIVLEIFKCGQPEQNTINTNIKRVFRDKNNLFVKSFQNICLKDTQLSISLCDRKLKFTSG